MGMESIELEWALGFGMGLSRLLPCSWPSASADRVSASNQPNHTHPINPNQQAQRNKRKGGGCGGGGGGGGGGGHQYYHQRPPAQHYPLPGADPGKKKKRKQWKQQRGDGGGHGGPPGGRQGWVPGLPPMSHHHHPQRFQPPGRYCMDHKRRRDERDPYLRPAGAQRLRKAEKRSAAAMLRAVSPALPKEPPRAWSGVDSRLGECLRRLGLGVWFVYGGY